MSATGPVETAYVVSNIGAEDLAWRVDHPPGMSGVPVEGHAGDGRGGTGGGFGGSFEPDAWGAQHSVAVRQCECADLASGLGDGTTQRVATVVVGSRGITAPTAFTAMPVESCAGTVKRVERIDLMWEHEPAAEDAQLDSFEVFSWREGQTHERGCAAGVRAHAGCYAFPPWEKRTVSASLR